MTEKELKERILSALSSARLLGDVDMTRSQFLDVGASMFVEIVLKDGAHLEEAQELMKRESAALQKDGTKLEVGVRTTWTVQELDFIGRCSSPPDQMIPAQCFRARLAAGTRSQDIEIAISTQASDEVRHTLTHDHKDADANAVRDLMTKVVRRFLDQHLANAGARFWNPLYDERLEINAATAEVLLWQIKAAEKEDS